MPITEAPAKEFITPPSTREVSSVMIIRWKMSSWSIGMPAGSGTSFGRYLEGTSEKGILIIGCEQSLRTQKRHALPQCEPISELHPLELRPSPPIQGNMGEHWCRYSSGYI